MKKNKDTEKETPAWMLDGRRFAAAIQQDGKFGCDYYKDFFDSDDEKEAKSMALNSAQREKCKATELDRKNGMICFRCDFTEEVQQIPKEDDLLKKKKRKK